MILCPREAPMALRRTIPALEKVGMTHRQKLARSMFDMSTLFTPLSWLAVDKFLLRFYNY